MSAATPGYLIGIDTGGTFTDAVVYHESTATIVTTAKAPTVHHDLSIGIGAALDAVMGSTTTASVSPGQIEMVSLSTTLATNALVEGSGRRVAAVMIGFDDSVCRSAGLVEALAGDPLIAMAGGHDAHGNEIAPLDVASLIARLAELTPPVEAISVTAQFAVRNPAHELAAAAALSAATGLPVCCSHQLSARLNGPKRAVTAVLNTRLIAIVDQLVTQTKLAMTDRGIVAPLMIVRGDGSLVAESFMRDRPIETILSGPAASVVGAAHLCGVADALVADIGGTTTDVAVIRGGVPLINPNGATVGGHATMVAAVDMHTHGIGGDSHVRHDDRATGLRVLIGPRRVVPISRLALTEGEVVHRLLDRHLLDIHPDDLSGLIVIPTPTEMALGKSERAFVDSMGGRPASATSLATSSMARRMLDRVVRLGVAGYAAFTATDAALILGMHDVGDVEAARKAALLLARQRDVRGQHVAADAQTIAMRTVAALIRCSAESVLAAAFAADGIAEAGVSSPLVQRALDRTLTAARADIGLAVRLIGLGASAATYYPAVGRALGVTTSVPQYAEVANAIGAVVGRVRITAEALITSPGVNRYVLHTPQGPRQLVSLEDAKASATALLRQQLIAQMAAAGATQFDETWGWDERSAQVGGQQMLSEGRMSVVGTGRPDATRQDVVEMPPSTGITAPVR